MSILESKAAAPFFLALLIGGCPKRQTVPRVVYVQPPAAGSTAGSNQPVGMAAASKTTSGANDVTTPAQSTETLVIEEPPAAPLPSEPITTPAPPAAAPTVQAPKRSARPRTESHDAEKETEPTESAAPASPAEVPSLEPQPDPGRVEETPGELQAQQDEIKRRITQLQKNSDLSTTEQRTLTDANSFWLQSLTALQQHDLLRARELAQKASLLLAALEKR